MPPSILAASGASLSGGHASGWPSPGRWSTGPAAQVEKEKMQAAEV